MTQVKDGAPAVSAADVIRIMSEQMADLHRQLAIALARAELAERQLAVRVSSSGANGS